MPERANDPRDSTPRDVRAGRRDQARRPAVLRPPLAVVPADGSPDGSHPGPPASLEAHPAAAPTDGADAPPSAGPPVSPRTLLTADPLLTMLEALDADVALLRDLTPRSDVPDALARVAARLRTALARAADGDVWVTTEDAARVRRLSESAVRWRIKHGKLRAEWRGGRWWIRRADVEAM